MSYLDWLRKMQAEFFKYHCQVINKSCFTDHEIAQQPATILTDGGVGCDLYRNINNQICSEVEKNRMSVGWHDDGVTEQ